MEAQVAVVLQSQHLLRVLLEGVHRRAGNHPPIRNRPHGSPIRWMGWPELARVSLDQVSAGVVAADQAADPSQSQAAPTPSQQGLMHLSLIHI